MKKCVIIGNANIERYDISKRYICSGDYIIYCDGGLKHMEGLGATPDLIIGDFDSYDNPNLDVETIVLPCEKDDTDTAYAVKEAIKRGYEEIVMLGVLGQRLDHTLGNVSLLLMLKNAGIHAIAVDDYSEMQIMTNKVNVSCEECKYFSLLNITGMAKHIDITGAKYNVKDAEITTEYQYGISNEVLPGEIATVTVGEGELLLVKVF